MSGWRDDALCRGRPTGLWYSPDPFEQAVALAVCRACPVRAPCAEAGLDEQGVWGGLSEDERARFGDGVAC